MRSIKEKTKSWWKQNLANIVSIFGLIVSLLFLIIIILYPKNILAMTICGFIASLTDFIDGPIARKLKCESIFGSYIDRIRDRIFIYPAIIILGWQYKSKVIFPELLLCLMASLIIFEVLLFRIGYYGLLWYAEGKDIDLRPNEYGRKKIFTGFTVVLIWIVSLGFESMDVPLLGYSIWVIYLGLILMIYWAYVSWKEYMERSKKSK